MVAPQVRSTDSLIFWASSGSAYRACRKRRSSCARIATSAARRAFRRTREFSSRTTAAPSWPICIQVTSDIVAMDEVGMSDSAWEALGLRDGAKVTISHPPPLRIAERRARQGLRKAARLCARSRRSSPTSRQGAIPNIQLSAFVTACAARALDHNEICALTQAMVEAGDRIAWNKKPIVDKHCVGGLPGNRTTPIIVAIVAACGLTIPKTSSRAITSPAGTADTMETLAPIDLDIPAMRRVVEREGGCIVWGGAARLSPTDDILIRDREGAGRGRRRPIGRLDPLQEDRRGRDPSCAGSAGGSDGEGAKPRKRVEALSQSLIEVGAEFGLVVRTVLTDGTQPVGRGIGPALEARNILDVLQGKPAAPEDLRQRALLLAGHILELGGAAGPGEGMALATATLQSGRAWTKFQRICEAQGGMRVPRVAAHHRVITATRSGHISSLDNRRLAKIAKLAGAPEDNAAGLGAACQAWRQQSKHANRSTRSTRNRPGELAYALNYARANPDIVGILES